MSFGASSCRITYEREQPAPSELAAASGGSFPSRIQSDAEKPTLLLLDRSVDAEAIRDKMNAIGDQLKQKLVETAVRPKWDQGKEVPVWSVQYQPHPQAASAAGQQ